MNGVYYAVYEKINYEFTRQGIPEKLIGVIDGKDLNAFVAHLKSSNYFGYFKKNRGHFYQMIDLEKWANDPAHKPAPKEFHIYPHRGIAEFSLAEWQTFAT